MPEETTLSKLPEKLTKLSEIYQPESTSMVLAAQAKAQIEARYVMAERHPRDYDIVRQKLLDECKRPNFARDARYKKPIGPGIEGFSIRFAETALRLMGNVSIEQMTIYDDREKRMIRVTVADCETNIAYYTDVSINKSVERKSYKDGDEVLSSRQNRNGQMVYQIAATEDDLFTKQNAMISKAIRTNGLRLVPKDIQDECEEVCRETTKEKDAKDPDAARRNIFDNFSDVGIGAEQLKTFLGHDGSKLTPKELNELRLLFRGIRDGETTWREIMDDRYPGKQPAATKGVDAVKDKLNKRNKKIDEIWPPRNPEEKKE